ncbi:response regulator transcription factor [Streptomyces sp. NPDC006539]|uniref:response regulator transcription factor n=1 Tax=Streptomyces sp. NPDC006539 TaxID=3155352 RepID=UPI0033AD7B59
MEQPSSRGTVTQPIRVVLADHQEFARVGIGLLLERGADIQVVGTAESSSEALRLVERQEPDVVLVDALLPPDGWLEVSRRVLRSGGTSRRTGVILMAQEHTDDMLLRAVRAGIPGYVLKNSPDWVLSSAVRSVAEGDVFLAGPVIRRLFSSFTLLPNHDPASLPSELACLNSKELQVTRCIGKGLSNREIAGVLGVAENTVKSYVSTIMAKLKVRNRVEVALTACRLGFVPLHPVPRFAQRGESGFAASRESK